MTEPEDALHARNPEAEDARHAHGDAPPPPVAHADELIFVSYAHADEGFVLALAANLRDKGYPAWIDREGLRGGDDWDTEIDDAIAECTHFVIVLSPESVASPEVKGELRRALDLKKRVVPVRYQECTIPRRLLAIQYVDFVGRSADDPAALQALRAALASGPAPAGPRPTAPGSSWMDVLLAALTVSSNTANILGALADGLSLFEWAQSIQIFAFVLLWAASIGALLWLLKRRGRQLGLGRGTPFWIALVFAILLSTLAPAALGFRSLQIVRRLEAETGVLVADFVGNLETCKASEQGRRVTQHILNELTKETTHRLKMPASAVEIRRAPALCSDEDARRLGARKNADLVVWGWVPPEGEAHERAYQINFVVVQPGEVSEVADSLSGIVQGGDIFTDLSDRSRSLVTVIVGLIQYLAGEYEAAVKTFELALSSPGLQTDDPHVWAAVTMYKGRTLAALGRTDEALRDFERILLYAPLDSPYGWARVGKAMIYYAEGTNAPDCELLAKAGRSFQAAIGEPSSTVTYVDAKAYYGLGSVYLQMGVHCGDAACCALDSAQACEPQACLQCAEREYQAALDEYARLDAPGEYSSLVHYGLAGVYEDLGDLERAVAEYDVCIELAGADAGMLEMCRDRRETLATPAAP